MDNNSLVIVEKLDAAVVFSEQGMTKLLDEIKIKVDAHDLDISTEDGRKDVVSLAYKITRSKTMIDDLGKGVVSEWKKKAKKVDEQRKIARDFLDKLKTKTRLPLDEWEAEQEAIRLEEERKEKTLVQNRIDGLLKVKVVMSFADIAMMDKSTYDVLLAESTTKYEAELARREEEQKARKNHEAELARVAKQQAEEAEKLRTIREEQEDRERALREAERKEALRIKDIANSRFQPLKAIGCIYKKDDLGTMSELEYATLFAEKHAEWLTEEARKEEEQKAIERARKEGETDHSVHIHEEKAKIEETVKPFDPTFMGKEDLIKDILILVGRLYLEDYNTCSPETLEVLDRWKPILEKTYNKRMKEILCQKTK